MAAPTNRRVAGVSVALLALIAIASFGIPDPVFRRVAILGGSAFILWLSEVVPAWVPTLLLMALVPVLLGSAGPEYRLSEVLKWAADPVLALFFGGFALSAAAGRHGIDAYVTSTALAFSGQRRLRLLGLVMAATAILSMWMSNIPAAAMMFAALRPHLNRGEDAHPFRRALLLGVAMGANLGGIATPIGAGPNGIAIASLEPWMRITFLQWMSFAVPLTAGLIALAFALIAWTHRVQGPIQPIEVKKPVLHGRSLGLLVVFALAVVAWLTEPVHGVAAPVVALLVAAALFGGGWLGREDLGRIDWSTLLLIAGGLILGKLIEQSGLVHALSRGVAWHGMPEPARIAGLVFVAAVMGALVSNTAAAAMLIPLAIGLDLPKSAAILIAIGTAFGIPFAFSSPPNAMAYGEGGLSTRDVMRIGLPLMVIASLLVGLTGSWFLGLVLK